MSLREIYSNETSFRYTWMLRCDHVRDIVDPIWRGHPGELDTSCAIYEAIYLRRLTNVSTRWDLDSTLVKFDLRLHSLTALSTRSGPSSFSLPEFYPKLILVHVLHSPSTLHFHSPGSQLSVTDPKYLFKVMPILAAT